jgi:hypothetical protein
VITRRRSTPLSANPPDQVPAARANRRPAAARLTALATALAAASAAVVVLNAAPAAAATPPTPSFPSTIDHYYPFNDETADCSDNVAKPGVTAFRDMVLAAEGGNDWGITSGHCDDGLPSGHKQGRAWDWNIPSKAAGDELTNWLLATDSYGNANARLRRFGISYIVWYGRIWEAYPGLRVWRTYACDGTDTGCHRNHVHFSFGWAGAWKQTTWWTSARATFLRAQVTVLEHDTSGCPGATQYFNDTDLWGTPISWTYANGSHACVRVAYTPRTTTATCSFKFYVPSGHATAAPIFGYWTTDGVKHYAKLDESPVEGWQSVFSSANVTAINFQDNNGQSYPLEIGWGSGAAYGMRQVC